MTDIIFLVESNYILYARTLWCIKRMYKFGCILEFSFICINYEMKMKWLYVFTGSMDEGVTEGLQSIQGTPNTTGHMEEDERWQPLCITAVFLQSIILRSLTFTILLTPPLKKRAIIFHPLSLHLILIYKWRWLNAVLSWLLDLGKLCCQRTRSLLARCLESSWLLNL